MNHSRLGFPSRAVLPALGVLAALALTACGGEAGPSTGRTILEAGLGTELDPIVNEGPGEWGATVREASLDLAIGTLDGDPPTVFGNISSLAVDDEGRIYALDSQATEVRIFAPDGTHLTTWGREGDGPGDLRRPGFLRLDRDGNVVVFSHDKTYRWFTRAGDPVGYEAREPSGIILRAPVDILPDGRFLDWDFDRETLLDDGSIEEHPNLLDNPRFGRFDRLRLHYIPIAVDPATGAVDTLPILTFEEPFPYTLLGSFGGGSRLSVPHEGRMWVAWTDEYLIAERSLDGTVHRSISRADARAPINPDTAIDRFFASIEERRERAGGEIMPPVNRADIPTTGPVIGALVQDERHLLVFTQEQGETPDFFADIFRKDDGRYLGKVEFPVRVYQTVTPVLRGRFLYGVTVHGIGYPQLVRIDLGLDGA